jgi:hypothetical protein
MRFDEEHGVRILLGDGLSISDESLRIRSVIALPMEILKNAYHPCTLQREGYSVGVHRNRLTAAHRHAFLPRVDR